MKHIKVNKNDKVVARGFYTYTIKPSDFNKLMSYGKPCGANADIPVTINGVTKTLGQWYATETKPMRGRSHRL